MSSRSPLQASAYAEYNDLSLFDLAHQYSFDYLRKVFDRNVFPTEEALADLAAFDEKMPATGKAAKDVISFLHQHGSEATVATLGGRYFGFVTGGALPVGLAAKSLGTFWDQNTPLQVLSPLSAKLESVCQAWLREILHLPDNVVAGFVSGSFAANFCGLAAARYRLLMNQQWDISKKGFRNAPPLRVVIGKNAHSTILKALALLGFGTEQFEWIDTDPQGAILPDRLPHLDATCLLVLQAGEVNSGAFDKFPELVPKARQAGAWVHVDGAFGLWAAACDPLNHLTRGMHQANSWAVDAHKTLNTPYDNGIALCADEEALVSALHMSGSYIILGHERDGMFYTPEMSRRARVIELWATLKYLGKSGISELVYGLHLRAKQFADLFAQAEGFEVVNDVVFNQVLVQCASDELTIKVMQRVQELRECWVGGSMWRQRKVIRISVCSWATTEEDVRRSAASFERARREVRG